MGPVTHQYCRTDASEQFHNLMRRVIACNALKPHNPAYGGGHGRLYGVSWPCQQLTVPLHWSHLPNVGNQYDAYGFECMPLHSPPIGLHVASSNLTCASKDKLSWSQWTSRHTCSSLTLPSAHKTRSLNNTQHLLQQHAFCALRQLDN
jgi:hypothetical protein